MDSWVDLTPLKSVARSQSASATPRRTEGSSGYHRNCGSEQHRRRRWSPYERNSKPQPVKSLSLETVSPLREAKWNLQFLSDFDETMILPGEMGNQTVSQRKGRVSDEKLAWYGYAKFLRAAWRKTRASLCEQAHRAESSELQAKYTMAQVSAMKSQLQADIGKMREYVKQIDTTSAILDELEEEKNTLQIENDLLKAKLGSLSEDRNRLNSLLSVKNHEHQELQAQKESLRNRIAICKDELTVMKAEKSALDQSIQDLLSATDDGEEMLKTGRNNLYNLELEINDIQRAFLACCDSTKLNSEALKTASGCTSVILAEIHTATEGSQILQAQLDKLRGQVIERDAAVAELRSRVALTAADIANLKSRAEPKPGFGLWRRFKVFNSDSGSLISFQI